MPVNEQFTRGEIIENMHGCFGRYVRDGFGVFPDDFSDRVLIDTRIFKRTNEIGLRKVATMADVDFADKHYYLNLG